jgi:hypothetical protein
MAGKKRIEKFGLQLTQVERKLILDSSAALPKDFTRVIESTPAGQPIMMTLDGWRELVEHIASEANDVGDKELQKKLDTIFTKLQNLLDSHTDEEPPTWKRIEQRLARESVQLAEWAQRMLISAEQLGIKTKTVARFSVPEVEALMITPTIDESVKKKLAAKRPKLTVGEIGGLLIAVSEWLIDAPPLQQFALILIAKSLKECLEEEVKGALSPETKKTRDG